LLRSKYIGLEAQELCTRIAVEGQCALIDCDKGAGFVIDDPHRQRIGFEDAPKARLARCQALVDRLELCDALTQMLLYLLGPLERLGVFLIAGIDSACSMRAGLHDEGRRRHGAGTLRRLREHCIDCGGQRLGGGGTGQETLRAALEREALIFRIVVPARVENEWHVSKTLVLLPLATQSEAVHARQDDVRDDRVRRLATSRV